LHQSSRHRATMAASPQPNDDDAEVQAHVAAALDDGLGGSALLSRLHEAKPSLNMEAMQAALKTAQKTEDARLFDLIAENYRDFFSLAQSLDTSAEVRNAPPPKPPRARAATPKPPRRSARSRGPRCWPSTARCRSRRACGPTSAGASRTS